MSRADDLLGAVDAVPYEYTQAAEQVLALAGALKASQDANDELARLLEQARGMVVELEGENARLRADISAAMRAHPTQVGAGAELAEKIYHALGGIS